jgi:hypothetical protein
MPSLPVGVQGAGSLFWNTKMWLDFNAEGAKPAITTARAQQLRNYLEYNAL